MICIYIYLYLIFLEEISVLFSGKFLHSCFICCTGHCSITRTCSISVLLSSGLAVTHRQFTLCWSCVTWAQWRFSLEVVVVSHLHRSLLLCRPGASVGHVCLLCQMCNPLGIYTASFHTYLTNKRFLWNSMAVGHLGQGKNPRRCPKQKVRFHKFAQCLPCCFPPSALCMSVAPDKAPSNISQQDHESWKPIRKWLTTWRKCLGSTTMAKPGRIPIRHIYLGISTITLFYWTCCLIW